MDTNEAQSLRAMAEAADAGLTGLDARTWLERLEGSMSELRSGLEWLLEHDRPGALRMATDLAGFWRLSGRIPEGRAWLDQASAAADPEDATMPRALYENALLAFWQGHDAVSRSLLERSLEIARRSCDRATWIAPNSCVKRPWSGCAEPMTSSGGRTQFTCWA